MRPPGQTVWRAGEHATNGPEPMPRAVGIIHEAPAYVSCTPPAFLARAGEAASGSGKLDSQSP
jgi:hypothetical protein